MRYLYLSLALAAQSPFVAVHAADQNQEPEAIVVTASRTTMKFAEVGSSFTVIDREQIEARQSIFVTDLLRDVPGVSVTRSGNVGSFTEVRARGAEANQVLVMIDGVRANDPAGFDTFRWEYLTTADVERVEIVRGPQSALWGSDAVGGVINIITRRPDQPMQTEAFVEGGSFSTFNGGARIASKSENVQVDASASYLSTDGTNIARQGSENDGYRNLTTTLNLGYTARPNLHLSLLGRYTDARTDTDGGFPLPVDAPDRTEGSQLILRAGGDLSLYEGRWAHGLAFAINSTENDFFTGFGDSSNNADRLEIDYQTTWKFASNGVADSKETLTAAVDYQRDEYEQRGFADQDQETRNTGYVLEYRGGFFERLNVSAAVRHDNFSEWKDVNTFRLTGSYRIGGAGTQLRGSIGTGQKAPTFTERFGFFPNSFVGNPNLKPEKSEGWEIGVDQPLANGRFLAKLTYFDEQLTDEIVVVQTPATCPDPADFFNCLSTSVNATGKSDRNGLEFSFNGALNDALDATLTYTYLDAGQPDGLGGTVPEPRRPENMANVNVNYGFLEEHGNLNLNVSYTGSQYDGGVKLSSYTLIDLAARFQVTDRLQVYGRVENLLDEDYEEILGFSTPGIGVFVGIKVASGR